MAKDKEEEKDLFKINVQEIVDNWGGYSIKEQCDGAPAYNSGTLELKCFINNQCPFNKTNKQEDVLVFNENTVDRIIDNFPDELKNAITTTSGVEGIHLKPRYVFRHNYIFYKDIIIDYETFDPNSLVYVSGSYLVNYRDEQTWNPVPSVFDRDLISKAEWRHTSHKESDSNPLMEDIKNDYRSDVYAEYNSYFTYDPKTKEWIFKKGTNPVLIPNEIQVPQQVKTSEEFGSGVHWRLLKNTELYRGEDFFIKFYKKAKSNTVKKASYNIPSFSLPEYESLDVTLNAPEWEWDPDYPDFKFPVNGAVKGVSVDASTGSGVDYTKYYDLSSQAYYVIELGHKLKKHNYFIMITERSFPIFAVIENGMSRLIGEPFKGISGKALIMADEFMMTVRNHLGKLVIEFEVSGRKIEPWIIEKTEREIKVDETTGQPIEVNRPSMITVPRGRMALWGGNLLCGFSFGPLQYSSPGINITYPPGGRLDLSYSLTFEDGTVSQNFTEPPEPALYLPSGVPHSLKFANLMIDKGELNKDLFLEGADVTPSNKDIFTQDSQFYEEWEEEYDEEEDSGIGVKSKNDSTHYGAFFYKQSPKEIGYTWVSDTVARTSGLSVRKLFTYDDPKTRKQAFNIIIQMICGDHIFNETWTNEHRTSYYGSDTGGDVPEWRNVKDGSKDPDEWLVKSCKTPILTSLRLIAEDDGIDPRWEDGTTIAEGVAKTPYENEDNKYFVDATDHVLNFSDNWSSTEFTQIDHTGTVNFLLNQEQPFATNHVVDKLYGLQDRAFYIEIWAGYRDCSYSKTNGFFKLFTGLCFGGSIDYQYGKTIMSCKIVDYTAVLEDQLFINAPFFDGMKDVNAINEILKMAGFRYKGVFDPGSLVEFLANSSNNSVDISNVHHIDGRLSKFQTYALPSGYNRLDQPMFKFDMGTNFLDGIREITKKSTKVFFFDQMGIAHYESIADLIKLDYLGKEPLEPLYKFTTNPELFPGQMIFNKIENDYTVEDVYNHIKIISNTPDFKPLIFDNLNWNSVDNPDIEGFIGYIKPFFQQEGLFGSHSAVLDALRQYSLMFRPVVMYNFETYGLPLRANDIIQINGENARVMKVDHSLSPEENKWWMTLECKRYQSVKPVSI